MKEEISAPFGPLVTAMVTPFTPQGEVDYERTEALARRLVEQGSSALVVCGTTGESPTLTPDEKLQLFSVVRRAVPEVPVIANTGDNETAFSTELSKKAARLNIDGLLLVVPYYNRPNQEGLYQHFKTIAQAVELPCLLYNVPGRTARNLDAATVLRLAEIPNIIGIKEASGDMTQVSRIRAGTAPEFAIYSGADDDTLPMLPLGCCGCISVVSHVAGPLYRRMMEAFWCGEMAEARAAHLRLLPVIAALFPASSPSPTLVKAGLKLQGFDCGGLRLPLIEATAPEVEQLRQAFHQAGLPGC